MLLGQKSNGLYFDARNLWPDANRGIVMPLDHSSSDLYYTAYDLRAQAIGRACMRACGWNLMLRRLDDCLPSRTSWKRKRMPQSERLSRPPLCSPELHRPAAAVWGSDRGGGKLHGRGETTRAADQR